MKTNPAVVAIGYNRVEPFRRLLNALENSFYDEFSVTLIISLDFGGDQEILELANNAKWSHGEKIVRTFEQNQGLKKHLIQCGDLSMKYGAVIIFEDDIFPSPFYYQYVMQVLPFYEHDERVIALSLYSQHWNIYANRVFEPIQNGLDVYASQVVCSWGECLIGNQWKKFKAWFEQNEIHLKFNPESPSAVYSWDKSWCKYLIYYIISHDKYFITPHFSLATNFNDAGTHMIENTCVFQQPLLTGRRKFILGQFDELVHYDAFSENIDLKHKLEERYHRKVCIDYFGTRDNRNEYDLCLSSVLLPYTVIATYGLELKPYELNVLYNIQGNDIFLYDLHSPQKSRRNWNHHFNLVRYDVKDLPWEDSVFLAIYMTLKKFVRRFVR